MLFTDAGDTFICTGTLINDSIRLEHRLFLYREPLHGFAGSREHAGHLLVLRCGDLRQPRRPAVPDRGRRRHAAGAKHRFRLGLLRLNSPPPANAVFSAWRAEAMANATPISVVHHPQGDLKKFSRGTMTELSHVRRRQQLRHRAVHAGLDRRRKQRIRPAHARDRRHLLRVARWPLRRLGLVLESDRQRLLFAPRRGPAAAGAIPDAGRGEPAEQDGRRRIL